MSASPASRYAYSDYSTLEVDSQAQNRNHYAYPEVVHESYPEVAEPNYPEVVPGSDPTKAGYTTTGYQQFKGYGTEHDALNQQAGVPAVAGLNDKEVVGGPSGNRTICGIQRKIFWIILAVAAVIIVGVIVGVTVGVVTSKSKDSSASDNSNRPGKNSTASTSPTALLPTTRIATTNFTDDSGAENYLVVYQTNDYSIYVSAWNSANAEWVVSPVLQNANGKIRAGSALTVDTFTFDDGGHDIHIYWQMPKAGGKLPINGLKNSRDKAISTSAKSSPTDWVGALGGSTFESDVGSDLISYGKACLNCNQYMYFIWQNGGGVGQAQSQPDTPWQTNTISTDHILAPNTSLAFSHAAAQTTDGKRSLNVFYRSTVGGLTRLQDAYGEQQSSYLGRDIGPNTVITAFSTGFNESSPGWQAPLGFQVLTLDPDANDGVQLTSFQGSTWTQGRNEVTSLRECKDQATMALNHGQRMYCLVQGSNGKDMTIVEFAWRGDPSDRTTYLDWERIGEIGLPET